MVPAGREKSEEEGERGGDRERAGGKEESLYLPSPCGVRKLLLFVPGTGIARTGENTKVRLRLTRLYHRQARFL